MFFNLCIAGKCEIISHCGLNLHFLYNLDGINFSHLLLAILDIFCKVVVPSMHFSLLDFLFLIDMVDF